MAARRKTHKQELKEYYAVRRAEARAQKAAGTYNKEEFARQTRAGRPLTRTEQKMAAEKEYRAARRAEARAQRIAGTFDKKAFAASREVTIGRSAEDIREYAEASREAREELLKETVRKNKTATKGAGAHKAMTAAFDLTEKDKRKELREQLEGEYLGSVMTGIYDAVLNDDTENLDTGAEGNTFDPDDGDDWARVYNETY